MGTTAVTSRDATIEGVRRVVYGNIAGSASYATNGETVSLVSLGLSRLDHLAIDSETPTKQLKWNGSKTAPKMLVDVADIEVANASNQTTATGKFRAVGRT